MEKMNLYFEACELLKGVANSVYERKKPDETVLCFNSDDILVVEKFLCDFLHSKRLAVNEKTASHKEINDYEVETS